MTDDNAPEPQPISLEDLLDLLAHGDIEQQGLLPWGSNYTFLVTVTRADQQTAAIYKPRDGERPLWDFPEGTLCQREVAAFVISQALDWFVVPPTVLRDGPHGVGMVQFYIDCDPNEHYFTLKDDERFTEQFKRIALFDLLINNADRKSGHCLRDAADHIWAIDHGLCFAADFKLRTVIWEFAGDPVPDDLVAAVRRIAESPPLEVATLLDDDEVAAMQERAQWIVDHPILPADRSGRRYPWPLV